MMKVPFLSSDNISRQTSTVTRLRQHKMLFRKKQYFFSFGKGNVSFLGDNFKILKKQNQKKQNKKKISLQGTKEFWDATSPR